MKGGYDVAVRTWEQVRLHRTDPSDDGESRPCRSSPTACALPSSRASAASRIPWKDADAVQGIFAVASVVSSDRVFVGSRPSALS